MADYSDEGEVFYEDIQIPCEFCDVLFPMELIHEHQSGCRPDLLHYIADTNVSPKSDTTRTLSPPPVSQRAKSPILPDPDIFRPREYRKAQNRDNDFVSFDAYSADEGKKFEDPDEGDDKLNLNEVCISDDDEEDIESLESFWKRAAIIMNKRLEKTTIKKHDFGRNEKPLNNARFRQNL